MKVYGIYYGNMIKGNESISDSSKTVDKSRDGGLASSIEAVDVAMASPAVAMPVMPPTCEFGFSATI
uniref:Uncharacterized protein n=1 Tax=Romanomermis culicivorax TaxID=13658 RepID=A0A915K9M7_ROMCU